MAGCISCFILPLLLFLFHRYLQPILLKFWNPWAIKDEKQDEGQIANSSSCKKCGMEADGTKECNNDSNTERLKSD